MNEPLRILARVALRVLAAASAFMLVFVGYAHVVSERDARQMLASPRETHFTSKDLLARDWTPSVGGGFSYDVAADALRVSGRSAEPDAAALFEGHETRLVESRLRARFRWTASGKMAVGVGFETVGETKHAIALEMQRDNIMCTLRLTGDAHVIGPGVRGEPIIAEAVSVPCDDDWHTIELRICPDLMRALASLDERAVLAPFANWDAMTLVRPTFTVRALDRDQPAGVEISEVSWFPVPVDLSSTDVDDAFNGKIIDPIWRVIRADPMKVDSMVTTGARGLEVTAHALVPTNALGIELATPTIPLGSLTATVDLDVLDLTHATIYFGIQNEPGPAWRFADVGVLSTGDGKIVPFESGHFDENGQGRFLAFPERARSAGKMSLTLVYDAATRRMRASLDGAPFADEHVDMPPRSLARFRIGSSTDSGGAASFAVRRVRIDHFEGK